MTAPAPNDDETALWHELESGLKETFTFTSTSEQPQSMSSKRFMELYSHVFNFCMKPDRSRQPSDFNINSDRRVNTCFIGHHLYNLIRSFIRTHLTTLSATTETLELMGEDLLHHYRAQWEGFTFSSKVLNGFCAYLNRHWVRQHGEKDNSQIYSCCLDTWKETLFQDFHVRVTNALLGLIELERSGVVNANASLIRAVVQSYVELSGVGVDANASKSARQPLSTYKECLEKQFLEATEISCAIQSMEFIQQNGVTEYMKIVPARLQEEVARVGNYFHPCTLSGLIRTVESAMIEHHLQILNEEFLQLLIKGEKDDLGRSYHLVSRLTKGKGHDKLVEMRGHFETHVSSQGQSALEAMVDTRKGFPKLYIQTIFEVWRKFSELVKECFGGDADFLASLDRACRSFVNENATTRRCPQQGSQKSAELLARYIDILLRGGGGCGAGQEMEIEEELNQAMIVFKYIDDKDIFQKYYSKMLAHRLVLELSASDEAETCMVGRLKDASGFQYTANLQRMHQDVILSRERNKEFKLWLATPPPAAPDVDNSLEQAQAQPQPQALVAAAAAFFRQFFSSPPPPSPEPEPAPEPEEPAEIQAQAPEPFQNPPTTVDFDVLILTSGFWPFKQSPAFTLPEEMLRSLAKFTEFYEGKYSGRKLTWLHNLTRGELLTSCFQRDYTLQVTALQMSVLLLYNDQEHYEVQEIAEATKLTTNPDLLNQVLQSLLKRRLLIISSPSSQNQNQDQKANLFLFSENSVLSLNGEYRNKKIRVNINAPLRLESKSNDDNGNDGDKDKAQLPEAEDGDGLGLAFTQIKDDRQFECQAAIVRVMKARKVLEHQLLISEVISMLASRFKPCVTLIQRCIDLLIEKEYLEKDVGVDGDGDRANKYKYVACA